MKSVSRAVASVAPQIQLTTMDCVVACVCMLTGRSYAEVFQGARSTSRKVRKSGAAEKELRSLAKGVGCALHKVTKDVDLDEDTGILWLESHDPKRASHAAVLFRGVLIDPSTGLLWDPHCYLSDHPHLTIEALFMLS